MGWVYYSRTFQLANTRFSAPAIQDAIGEFTPLKGNYIVEKTQFFSPCGPYCIGQQENGFVLSFVISHYRLSSVEPNNKISDRIYSDNQHAIDAWLSNPYQLN